MKRFLGIIGIAIRERLIFRFDFFMTLVSTGIISIFYYLLWSAVYAHAGNPPLPWQALITHVMIGQAINPSSFTPAERLPVYRTADHIRSGDIAIDFTRPLDFQMRIFLESAGNFAIDLVWVKLPAILLFIFLLGVNPPRGFTAAAGFSVSLCCAFLLSFGINSILMMTAYWTENALGVQVAKQAVVGLFSGTLAPFEFFPVWLKNLAYCLPFQGMANIPLSIYAGRITGLQIATALIKQLGWAALLLALSRVIWKMSVRRTTVYGG